MVAAVTRGTGYYGGVIINKLAANFQKHQATMTSLGVKVI